MTWKELGLLIKSARLMKGWSALYLGRVVGLSEQTIVSLEGGYGNRIPAGQFLSILSLLGFEIKFG